MVMRRFVCSTVVIRLDVTRTIHMTACRVLFSGDWGGAGQHLFTMNDDETNVDVPRRVP